MKVRTLPPGRKIHFAPHVDPEARERASLRINIGVSLGVCSLMGSDPLMFLNYERRLRRGVSRSMGWTFESFYDDLATSQLGPRTQGNCRGARTYDYFSSLELPSRPYHL